MKQVGWPGGRTSPLMQEAELIRRLREEGVCSPDRMRIAIAGRLLFVDGFVDSLDEKLRAERACRRFMPGATVVNRLRIAAAEERQVS